METAVSVLGALLLAVIALSAIGDKLNSNFKRKHSRTKL